MVNKSTNINKTTTSHLKALNTKRRRHMELTIQVLAMGMINVAELNLLMWSKPSYVYGENLVV